jgi:NAD(P)H-quinone oxidoreductase subunit 5
VLSIRGLALAIPVLLGFSAVVLGSGSPLRRAVHVTSAALMLAALVAGTIAADGLLGAGFAGDPPGTPDAVAAVMLLLITGMGLVIARYSRAYLRGDPGRRRYARFFLATLASVTLLVLTGNLIVLAAAWTATSVFLHQLLTFYPDRRAAAVAAHKKFLVSRIADVLLLGAVALIARTVGSVDIAAVHAWVGARDELPFSLHAAALLLAFAAALKSAQIPFHGWLAQVMEAPTPVSALLHAGVVNLGGFLMIRMSPLMTKAEPAQLLLVVVGTSTAVLAALVAYTRVSVKVALAWSTCAQMGFMLAECGLGAWHLALLHLVAHSLYKGHAFLGSGGAVDSWRAAALAPRSEPISPRSLSGGVALAVAVVATVSSVGAMWAPARETAAGPLLGLVLVLALAPFLARGVERGLGGLVGVLAGALVVATLYVGGHLAAERLFPALAAPSVEGLAVLTSGLTVLFVVQAVLQAWPRGWLARALHPWLFAGLYLDDVFTRSMFRIWPPRLPASGPPHGPLTVARTVEV